MKNCFSKYATNIEGVEYGYYVKDWNLDMNEGGLANGNIYLTQGLWRKMEVVLELYFNSFFASLSGVLILCR